MVFSSLLFIFGFLPVFLICYYAAPERMRNLVALLGSYLFYAWGEPAFALVLLVSSFLDYLLSHWLHRIPLERPSARRLVLVLSLFLNIGCLAVFKYGNFFVDQVNSSLGWFGGGHLPWRDIALPIGISFFTFQKLSYMIDVYRGLVAPAGSFSRFALYVALFPQLIAGPIVRYHDVARQLVKRDHTVSNFTEGIWRFALGLGKKVLVANVLAEVADQIFATPFSRLSGPAAWIGMFAYSFQIYFDFSGYSDMAIGLGRMMGFRFLENFNRPYIARNFSEFWQRWHISLSTWMREYLYIPLGGNRGTPIRAYTNLWIVFLLSGLWHGAAWTFLAWGAFHGLFLTIDKILQHRRAWSVPPFFARLGTFLLVSIGWVFFRSESISSGFHYLQRVFFLGVPAQLENFGVRDPILGHRALVVLIVAALISLVPAAPDNRLVSLLRGAVQRSPVRCVIAVVLLLLSVCSLANMSYNPFIYFRF